MYQHQYYQNRKSKPKRKIGRKIIFFMGIFIAALFLIYSFDLLIHRGKVYSHVIIMDQEIGKTNPVQANKILTPVAQKILSSPIVIQYDDMEMEIVPQKNIGASIDLNRLIEQAYLIARRGSLWQRIKDRIVLIRHPYHIQNYLDFDQEQYDHFLSQLQSRVEELPRDAQLKGDRIIPSKIGSEIDQANLRARLQSKMMASAKADSALALVLPVYKKLPNISTTDLLSRIGNQEEISVYQTSLQDKQENTLYNIEKAAEQINGIILKPGETFSFNQIIGPAEKEDGYKESTIIANGQFVNGYGGGVCQVSTTLYNAVLLANLQIIERYNHSVYGDATSYVPLGRDAAIFYGYKDLRFKNSLDQQIVIFCESEEATLRVTLFGQKPLEQEIRIVTQDKEVYPYDQIEIKRKDNHLLENGVYQEGVPGYSIKAYRIVLDSQGERRELISQDRYISIPMKIMVD